jgi:hypothetical protein
MTKLNLKPTKESLKKTIYGIKIIDWIDVKRDRYEFIAYDTIEKTKWLMELSKFSNKEDEYVLYLKLATGQEKSIIGINQIRQQKLFYLTVGGLVFQHSNSIYNTYISKSTV